MANTANERQIGGTHYAGEYQHWDFVTDCDLGYLDGTATKYIARNRQKGQMLADLGKADHYIQKLIETYLDPEDEGSLKHLRTVNVEALLKLAQSYKLDAAELTILARIIDGQWGKARTELATLVEERSRALEATTQPIE